MLAIQIMFCLAVCVTGNVVKRDRKIAIIRDSGTAIVVSHVHIVIL